MSDWLDVSLEFVEQEIKFTKRAIRGQGSMTMIALSMVIWMVYQTIFMPTSVWTGIALGLNFCNMIWSLVMILDYMGDIKGEKARLAYFVKLKDERHIDYMDTSKRRAKEMYEQMAAQASQEQSPIPESVL